MAEKRKRKTYKGKSLRFGGGGRFQRLKDKIKKQYLKEGYSEDKAEALASATAAKIGRKKYGKKRFQSAAKVGLKRYWRKRKGGKK